MRVNHREGGVIAPFRPFLLNRAASNALVPVRFLLKGTAVDEEERIFQRTSSGPALVGLQHWPTCVPDAVADDWAFYHKPQRQGSDTDGTNWPAVSVEPCSGGASSPSFCAVRPFEPDSNVTPVASTFLCHETGTGLGHAVAAWVHVGILPRPQTRNIKSSTAAIS